ncbi:MAG: hypothetical protein K2H38_07735, partial [Muribaculaceae bacterium]|nr:hypothetical protein [Muribaculaceae bacterium]
IRFNFSCNTPTAEGESKTANRCYMRCSHNRIEAQTSPSGIPAPSRIDPNSPFREATGSRIGSVLTLTAAT